ncbi:2Fe-2S iron-sulfur cluster-binding protein [Salicibibacter kimchii]|uniref:Succinate dehydogenase/fumarate reductase N-terminal domain-containing protein n=1 Tax=Salicibibacter kimchii TaxID=2099786 RepID=A0A345BZE6_9BACI|nr:2Fe-2S iron-sulfur cluster-binding protein [Salicibibacter kimchii]AXF56327.1 hypothetical protein DT065_10050 [Salicibibacter kimchii]
MTEVVLQIVRGDEASGQTIERYNVPFKGGMSLLDAVFWVREHEDQSLSVRYSCRSANACKECMAITDGKPGYLCSIRAMKNTEYLIEPMKARKWIKDLVTELD